MNQRVISFPGLGRDFPSPEQVSGGERTAHTQWSATRISALIFLAAMAAVASAIGQWRRYRTTRALMGLPAWQRADCGIDHPDIPTTCEMEAAARRRIANRIPADWC